MSPFISICIPAYKNAQFLQRLLDSIFMQTFSDFEVVISDDSPNDEVENLVKIYSENHSNIFYQKNKIPFGMPENWNVALGLCKGEWIKIMHDDDWFLSPESLTIFAEATKENIPFIVADYCNYFLETKKTETVNFPKIQLSSLLKNPMTLMAKNIIGPPSVCMVHRSLKAKYDKRLRWRVDIDYYIFILKKQKNIKLINKPLIYVGMNEQQITNSTKNHPEVELPEAYILLKKYGTQELKNVRVYDAWWRMFRNMKIYSFARLKEFESSDWPLIIEKLLSDIQRAPKRLLNVGATSKMFMFFSYCKNRKFIN